MQYANNLQKALQERGSGHWRECSVLSSFSADMEPRHFGNNEAEDAWQGHERHDAYVFLGAVELQLRVAFWARSTLKSASHGW
eukprot:6471923-Amphidinium_carterae.1